MTASKPPAGGMSVNMFVVVGLTVTL